MTGVASPGGVLPTDPPFAFDKLHAGSILGVAHESLLLGSLRARSAHIFADNMYFEVQPKSGYVCVAPGDASSRRTLLSSGT